MRFYMTSFEGILDKKVHHYLVVEHGIACRECFCPNYYKCKRRRSYRFNNLMVEIKRFIYYHTKGKIDIHIPISRRYKIEENLSGTPLCPSGKARRYSCYDCIYCAGIDENCLCQERYEKIKSGNYKLGKDPEHLSICKYFSMDEYADKWDRNTGKPIF